MCSKIFDKVLPRFLQQLEEHFDKNAGPFICGDKLCIADFLIGGLWTNFIRNDSVSFEKEKWQAVDTSFPKCAEYGKKFIEANAKRLEAREAYGV